MLGFLGDYATFLIRWLHVVAAIAWIGESFYFVALDRGLKKPKKPEQGMAGESWSVHGGGFYHKQKYLPAPAELPEELHWSKWKSYTTWLSGFALFALMYLAAPGIYLIDPAVAALTPHEAVGIAIAFLLLGWIAYDALCHAVGFRDGLLGVLVGLLVLALCYTATHLFAGRAAFLLVGAVMATIMSANVFFVIIPGQKRMVAALERGETPNPLDGQRGKQRSVHNTYFTLPVVFAMLSTHYATAYAHAHSWLVLAVFMAAGALIRQFFVLWHSGGRAWGLLGVGGALLLGTGAWLMPKRPPQIQPPDPRTVDAGLSGSPEGGPLESVTGAVASGPAPTNAEVLAILAKRCGGCHSSHPNLVAVAPLGAIFETEAQLATYAQRIHQQTILLKVMPPGNLTGMTNEERASVGRWAAGSRP